MSAIVVACTVAVSPLGWGHPGAGESDGDGPASEAEVKDEAPTPAFEFSLASAHSFPTEHIFRYGDNVEIVPPTSVLLLIEYFLTESWRVRFMYDLATTTDKRIIDGVVEERMIPSSISAGLTWVPLAFSFRERSRVEFQGTLYMGTVLQHDALPFPAWTGRIHLMQDTHAGVGVYLGAMVAFRRNTAGPFYGVGYRF